MEKGEKSTKYFLQLEKRNGKRKEIHCVQVNGKVYKENISHYIDKYYRDLYAKGNGDKDKNESLNELFDGVEIKTLSKEEADSC